MTNPTDPAPPVPIRSALLRRRPTGAGIAATSLIAFDVEEGVDLAPAALVHFGAAALRRRSTTWPLFLVPTVVIVATEALGGGEVDPTSVPPS
ncbi:hypothetical protein [Streptomyces sp. NPDC096132]|uniref:hypothetical protein n=1 Tax=Streptomyces sp. NPDC096132 TaxID=3366075 RepID=UPI003803EAFA